MLEDVYGLSPLQEGLYYYWLSSPESPAYFMQLNYRLSGVLDISLLERSYRLLVGRHAVLRTFFTQEGGDLLLQVVRREMPEGSFVYRDVSGEEDFSVEGYRLSDRVRGFDLHSGSQMRLTVLGLGAGEYEFIWSHHHILMDGWCVSILIREFFELYYGLAAGGTPLLKRVHPYSGYITWLGGIDKAGTLGYWREQLSGYDTLATLPGLVVRGGGAYAVRELEFGLGGEVSQLVRELCMRSGVTENTFIRAVWAILLGRYNDTDDVVFGAVVSGRPGELEGVEEMIGLFINTIPVRLRVGGELLFGELLQEAHQLSLEGERHHYVQLAEIQAESELGRNLFDHIMVFENFPIQEMVGHSAEGEDGGRGLSVSSFSVNEQPNYDLTITVIPGAETVVRFTYNEQVYDAAVIERMREHFLRITASVSQTPMIAVRDIEYLGEKEKRQLLVNFNDTKKDQPSFIPVTALFERQAARLPESIALVAGGISLSYGALNKKADHLAACLKNEFTTGPGDLVGIMLDRSENMIISILAILKAGCAYVPIDPSYPRARKQLIIANTTMRTLITQTSYIFDLENYTGNIFAIDVQLKDADIKGQPVPAVIGQQDLAYVIYTSGSTGTPKGCAITQGNLFNYINWANDYYFKSSGGPNFGLYTSLSFDLTVTTIFCCLTQGGRLTIYDQQAELPEILMHTFSSDSGIDSIKLTPAHINIIKQFVKASSTVQRAIVGGEQITAEHVNVLKSINPAMEIYNEYGPTETTVGCIVTLLERDVPIRIGRPISNTAIYILGKDQGLCPIGVCGEMYISGAGVGRGYINSQELTDERFLNNPYRHGELMYRTGDIGRWRPDGEIEFTGRKDDQVKIRGYRVECGEIASVLLKHEAIDSAVVEVRNNKLGEPELIAYLVSEAGIEISGLRRYLSEILPVYMLPSHFVRLDRLPLTQHGKMDRKSLPGPEGAEGHEKEYVAAGTITEEKLIGIWKDLLGREVVGIKDDFFEMGGHSLIAIRLAGRIHKDFGVKVALNELFTSAVLEDQAKLIVQAGREDFNPIPAAGIQPHYPLSSSQRRLWILSQFTEGNVAYNIPGTYILEGKLEPGVLEFSFRALIARHEILRTVFKEDGKGEIRQFVRRPEELIFNLVYEDLQGAKEQEAKLYEYVDNASLAPFDLANGPLLRAGLYRLDEEKWVLTYVLHHIISDGWSMNILVKELFQLYNTGIKHEMSEMPPLGIQYKDYAFWQGQQLTGETLSAHQSYWLGQFAGALPGLELTGDKPRPIIKTYHGGVVHKVMDGRVLAAVKRLVREEGGTLFMGLLGIVDVLLYRYTGQSDIIVGSPVAGREHHDLEDQIGLYINTIALRVRFCGDDSFKKVLAEVKQVSLGAFQHQVYPFDDLIDKLGLQRDTGRSPLFDVMVVLENKNDEGAGIGMDEISIRPYNDINRSVSKFDLTFHFTELQDELHVELEYNTDIYYEDTIVRMANNLERLMEVVAMGPLIPIRELDYLAEDEKRLLLVDLNDTAVDFPVDKTISELFSEQVQKTPDNIAVVYGGVALSYRQLEEKSRRLSRWLCRNYGIRQEDRVGIMLDRSENLIISILAILRAGAAYVPIDTDLPGARKAFIIRDTGIRLLITQTDYLFDLDGYDADVFAIDVQLDAIDEVGKEICDDAGTGAIEPFSSRSLAYIMYTSGSMGVPKGVMVEHRSVVRLVRSTNYIDLKGRETLLSTGAVSFDATTFEYWGMLLNGGCLVLCRKEELLDEKKLAAIMARHGIDTMWFTSGWLNQLVNRDIEIFGGLKTLLAGGDKLSPSHINELKVRYPDLIIVNGYGPTENTTFSLTCRIDHPMQVIPIGKPIHNSTVYILDGDRQLLPMGAIGEICVGGAGLARGYLNNPDATNDKFVTHPFRKGEKIYLTGDLGRWMANGNIEFAGRKDDQVKVRGYRVEPGEIESALRGHPAIRAAAVIAKPGMEQENELTAFIVCDQEINIPEVRAWLAGSLPDHMIPLFYVRMDVLPLTPNGKVDRKILLQEEVTDLPSGRSYIAPRNQTEEKLTVIWQEILGLEQVGVKDDFFDLGGHSLKVTRLASQIHKVFEIRPEFSELFSKTVLEEQAALLDRARKTSFDPIPRTEVRPDYPLSSSQRRLWILSQLEEGNVAYNIPGVYVFEGNLDPVALTASFKALMARHEILRTVFREGSEGEIRQLVYRPEAMAFTIASRDLRMGDERQTENAVRNSISNEIVKPFDLSEGPLFRLFLYRAADDRWVFCYVMHHIISDGWSMGILINELLQLYNDHSKNDVHALPALRIQYKDYAVWQQGQLKNTVFEAQRKYWLGQFEGELPVLELRGDRPRPVLKTFNGGVIEGRLPHAIVKGIKQISRSAEGTLFMGLLAAVNTLLYRYTGQKDIVIGSPIAGREHIDLEDQIGFYVNTLALRTRLQETDSFESVVEKVREVTIEAYRHQAFPFDELVDSLDLRRDLSRSPLFDVMVILQNAGSHTSENGQFGTVSVSNYEGVEQVVSKFDLEFTFAEAGEALQIRIEYNSDIFDRGTIVRLMAHFEQLLCAVIVEPSVPIGQLNYLDDSERAMLLKGFNATSVPYDSSRSIVDLFRAQVLRTPQAVAVVFEGVSLSYGELDERSELVGRCLRREHGVVADDLVGLLLPRGEGMLVAMLGVLKSGGGYVPIDLSYPAERVAYMVGDSGCRVVIDAALLGRMLEGGDEAGNGADAGDRVVIGVDDLAYCIYTSGSTGQPKGCLLSHGNVVNFFTGMNALLGTEAGVMLSLTNYTFDISVLELLWTLTLGYKVVIQGDVREVSGSRYSIRDQVSRHGATHVQVTPSMAMLLRAELDCLLPVRKLLVGGERLSPELAAALHEGLPEVVLYNMYGPTETTIFSCCGMVERGADRVTIGRPIANTQIYILDEGGGLLPLGVEGELYIGGAGVARSYGNKELLTAERFLADPFRAGGRMYRTGDFGRWQADGRIDLTGRRDEQVKIRGYRIELGEIERVLCGHALVGSAVVVLRSVSGGEGELVAYVTSGSELTVSELRSYAGRVLPGYMLPSYYVQLGSLPLTVSGKIDRKRLPDPEGYGMSTGEEYVGAETEGERVLVEVLEEVLKRRGIGLGDNYFVLGGDSIKSIQIVSRLKRRGYTIGIRDIMLYPVLEDMAERLKHTERQSEQGLVEGLVPLSPVQAYFLGREVSGKHHYNQSVLLYSGDVISAEGLGRCLSVLVSHHDALRMVYRRSAVGWEQENLGLGQGYRLEVQEWQGEESLHAGYERLQSELELSSGPLLRAGLFRVEEGDRLLLVLHHLVTDGVSWRILLEDLSVLYDQYASGLPLSLPAKTDSFRYWQLRQQEYWQGAVVDREEAYWLGVGGMGVSVLVPEYAGGRNLMKDVSMRSFKLDREETGRLQHDCYRAYHTEINDILLTGLGLALQEVWGMDRPLIRVEGHGREDMGVDVDVSRTVGWFTTMYPVVLSLSGPGDMLGSLIGVKEGLHRVPNKGLGYGMLCGVKGCRYGPVEQMVFNYLGDFGSATEGGGGGIGKGMFGFAGGSRGSEISPEMERDALLEFSGMLLDGELELSVGYSGRQYSDATIGRLMDSYRQQLGRLIEVLSSERQEHLSPVDLTYKDVNTEFMNVLNVNHDIKDIYPLSPLQEGMYYHWRSAVDSPLFFEQLNYRLSGVLDISLLERSYRLLVGRHAVLRTFFTQEGGDLLLQVVRREMPEGSFVYRDVSGEEDFSVEGYRLSDRVRGFDLHSGSQMRLTVLGLGAGEYEFIWSHHHILMDGWCVSILIREFFELYYGLAAGGTPLLKRVHPYSGYITWLGGIDKAGTLGYWREQLSGYDTLATLPGLVVRGGGGYAVRELEFGLGGEVSQLVRELCMRSGVTENTFIRAVWAILLGRYNDTDDVVFGAVVSGRPGELEGVEDMIGLFINTIPVRLRVGGELLFGELLQEAHRLSLEGERHHYVQLAEIQAESELGRNLFDHIMVFENFPIQEMVGHSAEGGNGDKGLSVSSFSVFEQVNYDLTIKIIPGAETVVRFTYNEQVYDAAVIERMREHFLRITASVSQTPMIAVRDIEYLGEEEKRELFTMLGDLSADYPRDQTITSLFGEQVGRTPDNIAVVYEDAHLSYRELHELSNQFGHYLRIKYGISAEDLVAIKVERSHWMIVIIFGVIKSGGAYVPIDPEYPQERIDHMIADSGCKAVIDESELQVFRREAYKYAKTDPEPVNTSSDLAYVIYTSGTTGKPKGTLIQHNNVVSLLKNDGELFDFNSKDVWTLFHSYCFDFSVWEMYGALLYGGRLIIVPSKTARDPKLFLEVVTMQGVTVLNQTPSAFYNLIKQALEADNGMLSLRYVIFGGEALSPGKLSEWRKMNFQTKLINMYGITETTVHVTYKEITASEIGQNISNIGRPIPTLGCYVLDRSGNPLPVGAAGELYVGGEGVCRGYLNREELTAARFIKNPFAGGGRLYRSGDKVRILESGDLEYLGRMDDQVKIRGYRIELGEIENALQSIDSIENAVVLAGKDNEGHTQLAAYIVSREQLNTLTLRSMLGRTLPDYMIPSTYIQLQEFPLTKNGKLDKKALPAFGDQGMVTGVKYVSPRNMQEEKITAIWEKLLGRERIGISDNFFDLGGDSIKILRMVTALRKELKIDLSVAFVYRNSTIADIVAQSAGSQDILEEQARLLRESEKSVRMAFDALKDRILSSGEIQGKGNIEDIYPMSAIEKGMLSTYLLNEGLGIYHDQFLFRQVIPDFKLGTFIEALRLLVEKHAILRTGFDLTEHEQEVQVVYRKIKTGVEYRDVSTLASEEQESVMSDYMRGELEIPFKIASAPMWRMSVFNLGYNAYGIIWQFHHAILDGWSNASFMTELNDLYWKLAGEPSYRPEKLKSDYKDHVVRHYMDQNDQAVRDFWRKELSDSVRLDLFMKEDDMQSYSSALDGKYLQKLLRVAREWGTTVKVISLSAYLYMLKVLSSGNEIVIGLVTNTRPDVEDSDKVLGCFLNTIPLRLSMDGGEKCLDLVRRVHTKLIDLKDKERLSLSEISLVNEEKQEAGNPFFDVLFNYNDFHIYAAGDPGDAQEGGDSIAQASLMGSRERTNTYFDCSINITGGRYGLYMGSSKKLKCLFPIEKIANLYVEILDHIIGYPDQSMNALQYPGVSERALLLSGFNATSVPYDSSRSIVDLFRAQVLRTPQAVAVVFEGVSLSYGELDERSELVGRCLRREHGVVADDLVGLLLPRGEGMLVAMLGVLKSGGGYVPIDLSYPAERVAYMVGDSGCRVVIDAALLGRMLEGGDEAGNGADAGDRVVIGVDDLAYCIYTSGSTGQPKGCLLSHGNVVNFFTGMNALLGTEAGVMLSLTNYTFDISVLELLWTLTLGYKVVIQGDVREVSGSRYSIRDQVSRHGATHVQVTPSMAMLLRAELDCLLPVRKLLVGGERLSPELAAALHEGLPEVVLYNMYGPTETTIWSCCGMVERGADRVTIGRPIANTQIYILDEGGGLLPLGVEGELYIGGAGVARSYGNKELLTAERFLADPFRAGGRMYRTGDFGRWQADGRIDLTGRRDEQVKIRGYRIELGEIERVLCGHALVGSAVVVLRSVSGGEGELVAYVTSGSELTVSELRSYAGRVLPGYMLPSYYVQLGSLPLTVSGKIDRKRLPDPEGYGMSTGEEYVGAETEGERVLVEVLEEVLKRRGIGLGDNYFVLGGDSIKSIQIVSRLKRRGYTIGIRDIMLYPVLEDMAERLKKRYVTNAVAGVKEYEGMEVLHDVSYNQLYYISEWAGKNPVVQVINEYGQLDIGRFTIAIMMLVQRHENLRTIFNCIDGRWQQKVLNADELPLNIEDPIPLYTQQDIRGIAEKERSGTFDLYQAPLFSIKIGRDVHENHIVILTIHHAISDGYSIQVMHEELQHLYTGISENRSPVMKVLPFQYSDFTSWQRKFLESEKGMEHGKYWLKRLEGFKPAIKMHSNGEVSKEVFNGQSGIEITGKINGKFYEDLHRFARENGLTLNSILMGGLILLLRKISDQEDITIVTSISGRQTDDQEEIDTSELIGCFVNFLFIRNVISVQQSSVEYLKGIQANFMNDLHFGAYPFMKLVSELPAPANTGDLLNDLFFYNYNSYDFLKQTDTEVEEKERAVNDQKSGLEISEFKDCIRLKFVFSHARIDRSLRKEIKVLYFSILKEMVYTRVAVTSAN